MSKETPESEGSIGNDEIFRGFQIAGKSLMKMLEPLAEAITKFLPLLAQTGQYVEVLSRANKIIDAISETGWLPFHTMGIDYIEESLDGARSLESRVSEYYENNWEDVRRDIESRMSDFQISDEAKGTFREAMAAHEIGHYRCVCRVLFPEIDRELRIQFFNDKSGFIRSKDMLKALANRGSLEDYLPQSIFSYILFGRLINHLYRQVWDSNRSQFESDAVPNRHAALHGLVRYSTRKHSMNMLIMADYIFEILTVTSHLPQECN